MKLDESISAPQSEFPLESELSKSDSKQENNFIEFDEEETGVEEPNESADEDEDDDEYDVVIKMLKLKFKPTIKILFFFVAVIA